MENNEIKVSVIVPVYKEHEYFEKCIRSLLAQKVDFRYEILLECFGSDETMVELAKKYEKEHPSLVFVYQHEKNYGISASRNAGILQARGTYISFVDSDDILEENFLSFMVSKAIKYPKADMISSSYYLYPKWKWLEPFRTRYHGEGRKVIYRFFNHLNMKYQVYCWARIYRTEFLKKNQISFFSDMDIYEDWPFFMEVLYHAKEVRFYRKQLYHYVQRKGSAVHRKRDALYYNLKAIKHIRDYLIEKDKKFAKKVFHRISLQMKAHMMLVSYISKEIYQQNFFDLYKNSKEMLQDVYDGKELINGPKKIL